MHPYDLRLDIPFRAMANAQIIAAATSDGALKPYIRTTLRNLPVDPASYQLLDRHMWLRSCIVTSSMTFGVESLKNFGHKYKGVI